MASRFYPGTIQSEEQDIKVVSQALHEYFGEESRTVILISFLKTHLEYFNGKIAKMFVTAEDVIIQPTPALNFLHFQDSILPQDKFALHIIYPGAGNVIVFAYQVFTSLPKHSQSLTSPFLSPELRSRDLLPCKALNIDKYLRRPDPVEALCKDGLREMFSPEGRFEWTQDGADQNFSIHQQGLYWMFTEVKGTARIVDNIAEALLAKLEFVVP